MSTTASPGASKPVPIALTMGDPCGIGPEIIAMACAAGATQGCVVLGDVEVMRRAVRQAGVPVPVVPVQALEDWREVPIGAMPVWAPAAWGEALTALPQGRVHAASGAAAAACIVAAARLAMAGEVGAVVTAPIHKEALALAGIPHPGHTELLQAEAGGVPVRMMLANDALRTVLVSIHVSLREAILAVTQEQVLQTVRIAHLAAVSWGLAQPRIAVAGLNPHAGEGGLFGREELDIIAPAVRAAQAEGIHASGPHAPDTVFMRARNALDHPGEFDVVVAMYHDQGLIPVKYLGLDGGVNVTLGLPFVRTSPDHGTAFDLAGRGKADPASFTSALAMARRLMSA